MFGGFLGFGLALLALTLPFEHPILLWVLFWIPLLSVIVGALLGWRGRLPPFRFVLSFALFTLLIGLTVFSHKAKQQYLQLQREKIAENLMPHYAISIEKKQLYNGGDGFDNEPMLSITFEDETPFEGIAQFYDRELSSTGWKKVWPSSGMRWRRDWYEIGLGNIASNGQKKLYSSTMFFYGSWIDDILYAYRIE